MCGITFSRSGDSGGVTRRFVSEYSAPIAPPGVTSKPLKRVNRIILDESKVRVGGERMWLLVALEPIRRVVLEVYLSKARNGLVAASFMRKLLGKYGLKVLYVTDGGKWYPWAAESLESRCCGSKAESEATWNTSSAPSKTA